MNKHDFLVDIAPFIALTLGITILFIYHVIVYVIDRKNKKSTLHKKERGQNPPI